MIGIHRVIRRRFSVTTPAVFLDRDGVIVQETGYLHKPAEVEMVPRTREAVQKLTAAGLATVVVTNQAGIARGYYQWDAFEETQAFIEEQLRPASFDGTWACGYHPEGSGPLATDHAFRKPNPGMVLDAAAEMNLDLTSSWLIGDKRIDVETAINAKLAGAILVRTGYGRTQEAEVRHIQSTSVEILICDDIYEAVEEILVRRRL